MRKQENISEKNTSSQLKVYIYLKCSQIVAKVVFPLDKAKQTSSSFFIEYDRRFWLLLFSWRFLIKQRARLLLRVVFCQIHIAKSSFCSFVQLITGVQMNFWRLKPYQNFVKSHKGPLFEFSRHQAKPLFLLFQGKQLFKV